MVLRWWTATCTSKCLMHGFSLVMIQLPIVSVSVGVQWSTPIFQPNNVQCTLINQIMLFLVDQCYYIVMWCWSPQIYKHAQCQLIYQLSNISTDQCSLDNKIFWKLELPGKIFLKHYFVINDFSDTVFFKRRFTCTLHGGFFSLLELPLPDTLIWKFLRLALNGCWVWISSGTAHSDLVSLQGHQYLSWQTLIFFWKLNSYAVVRLHCICTTNSLDGPLIGTVHIVVTCNVPVSCLKQIAFALKSKSTSSQKWYKFSSRLRAEKEGHCESWGTNP